MVNLFSLQEQGDAGWAHGRALATGNAEASASLHRGIDLSAGIDVSGEVGGDVGKGVEASLSAGGMLTGGLSFKAAYPLDLFSEAGLVARLRAQAAAAAFIRAEIALDSQVFAQQLRDQFVGPWLKLVDIFLSEVKIGAGLWGKVAASIQLLAEAAIVGNLLGKQPGFTCSFQYAAGYGYGAGMDFKANFDLSNPRRLLDRLADQLTAILEAEIEGVLPQLSSEERALATEAQPLLRFVMPLALRAIYEQGVSLAQPSHDLKGAASNSLVESVVREAQESLARSVFDLAISDLNTLLNSATVVNAVAALTGNQAAQAKTALQDISSIIHDLAAFDSSTQQWMDTILNLLDTFSSLSSLIASADRDVWNRNLALAWSAAVVVDQLIAWTTTSTSTGRPFDPKALLTLPSTTSIASYVATQVKKAPGVGLTIEDAIEFILLDEANHLQSLRRTFPAMVPLLDLLSGIFTGGGSGTLLQALFKELASFDETNTAALVGKIITALGPVVEKQIVTNLLDPLEAKADKETQEILKQVVRPTLFSLTRAILPRLSALSNADEARALRELISSVLLQPLTHLIFASTDILLDHAAAEGSKALRDLCASLRAGTKVADVDVALVVLAQSASLFSGLPPDPFLTPTLEDVITLIETSADIIEFWNNNERSDWLGLARALISLDLATGDAAFDALWSDIRAGSDTTKPISMTGQDVVKLAKRLASGLWKLVKYLASKLLTFVTHHIEGLYHTMTDVAATTIKGAIDAARQAAAWLDQQIDALEQTLKRLASDIDAEIAKIAGWLHNLSQHLIQQINTAIEAVQAAGWKLVCAAIADVVPARWVTEAEDVARPLYDDGFELVKGLLLAPLQMFSLAAGWVQDALQARVQSGTLSPDAVKTYVRNNAHALVAQALQIPIEFTVLGISFNLGTIVLPGAGVLSTLIETLLGDVVLADTIYNVVSSQNSIIAATNQVATLRSRLDDALTQEEANAALSNLTTGQQLKAEIPDTIDGQTYQGSVPLRIVLSGANRTFVTSVLGVPRRVKVLVNGQECHYAAESWKDVAGGLEYNARLVLPSAQIAPIPLLPSTRELQVEIPDGFRLEAFAGPGSALLFRAVAADRLPTPSAVPVGPIVVPPRQPASPVALQTTGPAPLPAHLEERLTVLRERSTVPVVDPFVGTVPTPSTGNPQISPVIVQKVQFLNASSDERQRGFRWMHTADMLKPFAEIVESIFVRPGLNQVEVIVVDGQGLYQASQGRVFFLTK